MKAPIRQANAFFEQNEFYLTLTVSSDFEESAQQILNDFAPDKYEVVIKRRRKERRSLSANAYLWVLLDQIACLIGSTKDEVYKTCVRAVGVMNAVTIPEESAQKFRSSWMSRGMGWFCDIIGNHDGMTDLACYYGSSMYDSAEMARLVDYVVDEAKNCGIETVPPKELVKMKRGWKSE